MPVCPCGLNLQEKDRMGSAAYLCPACHQTYRPAAVERQSWQEAGGRDPVQQ